MSIYSVTTYIFHRVIGTGQERTERRHWVHQFEGMDAVIILVNPATYDIQVWISFELLFSCYLSSETTQILLPSGAMLNSLQRFCTLDGTETTIPVCMCSSRIGPNLFRISSVTSCRIICPLTLVYL